MIGRSCGARLLISLLLLLAWNSPARALAPGGPAPSFQLPWLTGKPAPPSEEIFGRAPLTALVFWNRGCPRCTEIALGCDVLVDSLRSLRVGVTAILFGPDDPVALSYLLEERNVRLPHLWDEGAVARLYGLGTTHLGSFLVDSHGIVRAAFDDQVDGLIPTLVPAARRVLAEMAESPSIEGTVETPAGATPPESPNPATAITFLQSVELDARARLSMTDGSRPEDRGLLGEPLEAGSMWLHRVDLKYRWSPRDGIEIVPWLRWSNEDQAAAAEGAEQLSDPRGTLSLNLRRGSWHGALGAFPIRVSPLLLQRWDAEDAPPLGGGTGCGVCGGGVTGITARSLEILGPLYTLEGLEAGGTRRYVRFLAAGAIPRRERIADLPAKGPGVTESALEDPDESHYRKSLGAAVLDLGRTGSLDPRTDLARPFGLRLAYLDLNDDRRSIDLENHPRPVDERDERALSAWASLGPWQGVALESETVWWRLKRVAVDPVYGRLALEKRNARGFRAGARVEQATGPWRWRGRLHVLRTEPGFEPFYRALTYDRNREGWRGDVAVAWTGRDGEAGGSIAEAADRASLELFHRSLHETQDDPALRENRGRGRERETISSVSLSMRARDRWPAELHVVRARAIHPTPLRPDETREGISVDVRCTAVSAFEPTLRFDWIRLETGNERHAVRTVTLWVRVTG